MGTASCRVYTPGPPPGPETSIPQAFSLEGGGPERQIRALPWWEAFGRPALSRMAEQALENNRSVRAAYAALRQARAVETRTRAGRLPQIDGRGEYTKSREGGEDQRASGNAGAAFSWEIDAFGRISYAAEADRLEALARAEDIEALKVTLSAEVAEAYFGAVAAHQSLGLLREQLRLDRALLELLELRLDNGVGTRVDVLQQQARVADSQTLIPRAQSDLAVYENRLDVLLGEVPDGKSRVESTETLDFESGLPAIGVPAGLLLNRPDLRAARAELAAADAGIGAAIADRWPRLILDGSYLYSDDAGFTGPVALISGMFVQPLLDWGRRRAEVERNRALYEERLHAFTQLFLEAVEDVENALARERKQREFLARLKNQEDILKETVETSEHRYKQGIDDYLPVINALQELREVERGLIAGRLALVNFRIALYRAAGGPILETSEKRKPQP